MPESVDPYDPPSTLGWLASRPDRVCRPDCVPFRGALSDSEIDEVNSLFRRAYGRFGVLARALYARMLLTLGILIVAGNYFVFGRLISNEAVVLFLVCALLVLIGFRVSGPCARNRETSRHREGHVTPEAICWKTDTVACRIDWSHYKSYRSSPTMVVLVIEAASRMGIPLPRSHFASDADWQAFLEIVHEKLPLG